jgi:hypothetical protein
MFLNGLSLAQNLPTWHLGHLLNKILYNFDPLLIDLIIYISVSAKLFFYDANSCIAQD